MTMKECKEVLSKPVPSHLDKRVELKTGFKRCQADLVASLKAELGTIVNLASSETDLIERSARKAVVTWLDFQMHRCRIVVRPTGLTAKSASEKRDLLQNSSLKLTVLPTVGRYGNVRGTELYSFTVIKGCPGEVLEIS